MRNIYITVIALFVLSVLVFIFSFAYLDRTKHKTYYYVVNMDGRDIGTIKIDRYDTEDKSIYKSIGDTPYACEYAQSRRTITFDKKFGLASYDKEESAYGATDIFYIETDDNLASFISRRGPEFRLSGDIPIRKDTTVFEQDSPLTYLPIIENYNFRTGWIQGYDALIVYSWELPPMRKFISLAYLKDEYVKISASSPSRKRRPRKIRADNLVLKIRDFPQALIWVAKSDRSIIKIEIPKKGIRITRTFFPPQLEAKSYELKEDGYGSRSVSFKSGNIQLNGTMTVPDGGGKYPAVLLVSGSSPDDRDLSGLFTSIADHLSRNGFCVFRFDKRGIGRSGGDRAQGALGDAVEDINACLGYLASQKEVDAGRIAIVGHAEGAYYAMKTAAGISRKEALPSTIKSLVLMAPLVYGETDPSVWQERINDMARNFKWSGEYLKLVIRSRAETQKAAAISKNTISFLKKKSHLRDLRQRLAERPTEVIASIKMPVLILQGKEGDDPSLRIAPIIDKILAESGNPKHMVTYYGYVGPFFGKRVIDGTHKIHYEADKAVLENIKNWLDNTTAAGEPVVSII